MTYVVTTDNYFWRIILCISRAVTGVYVAHTAWDVLNGVERYCCRQRFLLDTFSVFKHSTKDSSKMINKFVLLG